MTQRKKDNQRIIPLHLALVLVFSPLVGSKYISLPSLNKSYPGGFYSDVHGLEFKVTIFLKQVFLEMVFVEMFS